MSNDWAAWATLISVGKAVIEYAPRTPEFNDLLDDFRFGIENGSSRLKKSSKKSKCDDSDDEDKLPKALPITINMSHPPPYPDMYGRQPSYRPRGYSDPSPRKPLNKDKDKEKKDKDKIGCLQDLGYEPVDWISHGLDDYFAWLSNTFRGSKLEQALTALKQQEIGLDSLADGADVQFLITNCKVSSGAALRIVNNFQRWLDEMLAKAPDDD